jgi:release factor glutamine methyltransferase
MAARRLDREPVSRIFGRREFWGLPFVIDGAVLDPRPETEGLVGAALDALGGRRSDPLQILDLGVGSGAILAALLSELPEAEGLGIDCSLAACRVARANLDALGLKSRAAIACGRWLDTVGGVFDLIVSNPPYIARDELIALEPEVRRHDPAAALDGGVDGLEAYRAITPGLRFRLRPGGVAAFECGAGQGAAVASLMRAAGFADPAIYLDLEGRDRVVLGVAPC